MVSGGQEGSTRLDGGPWSESSTSVPPSSLRTIHYLGSKLRLLGPIGDAIEEVAPKGATVCDLFAGSGTVSMYLSSSWNVVSSDIQEYSRVLCNGLLNPPRTLGERRAVGEKLVRRAKDGVLHDALCRANSGLIDYERTCAIEAAGGSVDGLCEIMECAPLVSEIDAGPSRAPLADLWRDARVRLAQSSLEGEVGSVVSRHFGGVYFSWRQAAEFDALLDQVHRSASIHKDYYLACVLAAASEVVNTVGKHFAQPARPRRADGKIKSGVIRSALRDRTRGVFSAFLGSIDRFNAIGSRELCHRVWKRDFEDLLGDPSIRFDVLYADPPYTRDHYSRYYHVLETMARHDRPDVSRTLIRAGGRARLSRGVYRMDRHQSPFCIRSKAEAAFHALAHGASRRKVPLVLSYSPFDENAGQRPRVLAADRLVDVLGRYFKAVEVCDVPDVVHRKVNLVERNISAPGVAEMLMICRH